MADINGTPFISILVRFLLAQGFDKSNIAFSLGYGADIVKSYYAGNGYLFVRDTEPQCGTGAAIAHAMNWISDPFFVVNGDTYCELDLVDLMRSHKAQRMPVTVPIDSQYRNVGVYLFEQRAIEIAARSLGQKWDISDAFTVWPKAGVFVNWYRADVPYYDIGTPDGLEEFRKVYRVNVGDHCPNK